MYNPYFKRNNIIRFYTRTIVNTANLSISITTTTLVETMNIFFRVYYALIWLGDSRLIDNFIIYAIAMQCAYYITNNLLFLIFYNWLSQSE